MQILDKTNIDFVSARKIWVIFSISLVMFGIVFAIVVPPEFGIDYTGGAEVAVKFEKDITTDQVRSVVSASGLRNPEIKSFGAENEFLIRIKEFGDVQVKIQEALNKVEGNKFEILKVDKIGAKVGGEMRRDAFFAVILAMIAMLIYVGFRFEFTYGAGAVLALVHDVLVTTTIIVIFNNLGIMDLEFNQALIAALLTVVGYSINNTVIIFDRIRENKELHKGMNFLKLVNFSINETLSRTIITVTTVLLALASLLIFGGPVLQGFAFTMFVGTLIGTYSSIYISTNFVIWYLEKVKKQNLEAGWQEEKAKVKTA